jgi:hypothetical protein
MKTKNINFKITALLALLILLSVSCDKKLEDIYPDPGKTSTASVERYFTGVLQSNNEYIMHGYWCMFVVEEPTMGHYTQTLGYLTSDKQYNPPAGPLSDRWGAFYNGPMTQFRVFEDLYNKESEADKADKRIFYLAAKIFFYDQTQQMVDLYGDIPWSQAGKLRANNGDLTSSLPKYDSGSEIYTAMLDDLKSVADELNTISVSTFYANVFKAQDFLNDGSIVAWKKYCNSLRLRMLMRVSGVTTMQSRVKSEVSAILNSPVNYPVVEENSENIQIDSKDPDLAATGRDHNGGIRGAMETWGTYNLAPKAMIDNMNANNDPRLEVMFDPGKGGTYIGVDPLETSDIQNNKLNGNVYARYDTATIVRNNYFPGMVITASEVSFIKAEAFQTGLVTGDAKAAYEKGIKQSVEYWYTINKTGDYRSPLTDPSTTLVNNYIASTGVSWDGNSDKIGLIGTQKWLSFSLFQLTQNWSEYRRLKKPALTFMVDNTSSIKVPPVRFTYPDSEKQLNKVNYDVVLPSDKVDNKIFWDVN